jgi:hypothetical protein
VAAYYPDWSTNVLSPQQIDFTRYDVVDFGEFAFGMFPH